MDSKLFVALGVTFYLFFCWVIIRSFFRMKTPQEYEASLREDLRIYPYPSRCHSCGKLIPANTHFECPRAICASSSRSLEMPDANSSG